MVAGGDRTRAGEPPARDHRQPRAVYKYWARMRIFYSSLFLAVTCSALVLPEVYRIMDCSGRSLQERFPYANTPWFDSGYTHCVSLQRLGIFTEFLREGGLGP